MTKDKGNKILQKQAYELGQYASQDIETPVPDLSDQLVVLLKQSNSKKTTSEILKAYMKGSQPVINS